MTKDWALVCHRLAACLITLSPFPHPGLGSEFESRERVLQESERWSEKAIEIYSALGDQDEVRRVKIGLALARMKHGRPGDLDRGIKEFEELRKSMADVEGFSSEKAAIYGNLFLAYLGRGRAKTAEAYFYESNLNYQYTGGFYFVERHYVQLYQHVLGLDRMEPDLPEAGAFYKSLIASLSAPNEWRLVVAASRFPRLVDQENLEESVKVAEDLLSGGRFYLEGSSLKKWGTMMATYACLLFDPRARATFAQRTLEIVKREVPGQTPLYSCLFDYASQQGLEVENLEKERSLPDNDKWILEDRAHLLSVKPPEKERLIQGIRFLLEHASRDLSL